MGISDIAVKNFNSSGAQSVCRANKADNTKLIESQFLTKCTMEYINGSGESIIPGSLTTCPTTSSFGSNLNQDTFYIPAVDAISSMDLTLEFEWPGTIPNPGESGTGVGMLAKDFILSFIHKIEIKMGGLVVQTICQEEIFMRNLTELGCAFKQDDIQGTPSAGIRNSFISRNRTFAKTFRVSKVEMEDMLSLVGSSDSTQIWPTNFSTYQATISIPFTGRSGIMKRSFLQAGAITNSLIVKAYYNQTLPATVAEQSPYLYGSTYFIRNCGLLYPVKNFKTYLTVKNHIITETEKNFISGNIINRIVNTSQCVSRDLISGEEKDVPTGQTTPRNGVSFFTLAPGTPESWAVGTPMALGKPGETFPITIDLSNIDINVSHLLIGAFCPTHTDKGNLWCGGSDFDNTYINMPETPEGGTNATAPLAELYSFSGFTIANKTKLASPLGINMRGILNGWLDSAELVIGNDRTGKIPSSKMLQSNELYGLKENNYPIYVITTADRAFSTAGISFSRANNKKLILNVRYDYLITKGPFTAAQTISDASVTAAPVTRLAVTACGTQVQTTVGGTISFAS
jgi:hypothetical protein